MNVKLITTALLPLALLACGPESATDNVDNNGDSNGGDYTSGVNSLPGYMSLDSHRQNMELSGTADLRGTWVIIEDVYLAVAGASYGTRYMTITHMVEGEYEDYISTCQATTQSDNVSGWWYDAERDEFEDRWDGDNNEFLHDNLTEATIARRNTATIDAIKLSNDYLSLGSITVNGQTEAITCFSQRWDTDTAGGTLDVGAGNLFSTVIQGESQETVLDLSIGGASDMKVLFDGSEYRGYGSFDFHQDEGDSWANGTFSIPSINGTYEFDITSKNIFEYVESDPGSANPEEPTTPEVNDPLCGENNHCLMDSNNPYPVSFSLGDYSELQWVNFDSGDSKLVEIPINLTIDHDQGKSYNPEVVFKITEISSGDLFQDWSDGGRVADYQSVIPLSFKKNNTSDAYDVTLKIELFYDEEMTLPINEVGTKYAYFYVNY